MSLRWRLALIMAAVVFFAFLIASGAAFLATRGILVRSLEESLIDRALTITAIDNPAIARQSLGRDSPGAELVGDQYTVQVLSRRGNIIIEAGRRVDLPIDAHDLAIALGGGETSLRTTFIDGVQFKIVTMDYPDVGAVQVARSLAPITNNLNLLRSNLLRFGLFAAGMAALVGAALANRIAMPVIELTEVSEAVTSTGRLDQSIQTDRKDEFGRLARSFDRMIRSLALSREQQQRLVMDASHELRTPLTSLRTNVDVLRRAKTISADERDQLLDDAHAEVVELSELVSELVELATDQHTAEVAERISLDELVQGTADRFMRRHDREVTTALQPSSVVGRPGMLERAISNLLENAHKWGPSGTAIEVRLMDGRFSVADHGPGIPEEERSRVFDRFYRTDDARTMQGSGLGLAIVRHIVETHAGSVFVEEGADGGAVVGFQLPGVTPEPQESSA